ncbi:MAG TPA: DUF72 domain-containing protein [Terracidiphilus sp.]|jgi:uncharacterized protein YecE (DUF72 family)
MSSPGDIRIGISGWRYKPWRGTFYPAGLAQRRELEFASRRLNSIELNGSFYSLQRPQSFAAWYNETPPDFVFSIKGSRFVTHMRRLLNVETPLANFFAQGLLSLKEKLGPILWQFPPNFKCDPPRLDAFFSMLPRTHKEAARLAKRHDERLEGRSWFRVQRDRPLRHAIEIRNETFVCEEFIALLRKHNIALVAADTVEWPLLMDVTADFVYCRLHGSEQLYVSGYEREAIDQWARRVVLWAQGGDVTDGRKASSASGPAAKARDVYVYFDNDAKVRAPFDALQLSSTILSMMQNAGAATYLS